jgi:hypothetical protein
MSAGSVAECVLVICITPAGPVAVTETSALSTTTSQVGEVPVHPPLRLSAGLTAPLARVRSARRAAVPSCVGV